MQEPSKVYVTTHSDEAWSVYSEQLAFRRNKNSELF